MSNKPKVSDPNKPRTLDEARTRIAELNAQLGGKQAPAGSSATTLKPVRAASNITSIHQAPATSAASVSGLASMEAIQSQIDGKTAAEKVVMLQKHAEDRMAKLSGMNHSSPEAQGMFKELQRIQKTQAYAMHSDPVLWANRHKVYPKDLL